MAETTLQLGFVPKERGNYTSGTNYYKDNVVQYNGSSYIADPVGWSESDPTATYVTIAPTDASGNLNAGWRVFASGNNTFTTGEKVDNVGIDSEPTAGSENLVNSGGVQNELALGAVYNVSAKNPTAGPNNDGKWESLSALLSDANLNTLIPTSVRKGGMSIKFVQSSDNKYIQYRLISASFSTDESYWAVSDNGVYIDNPEYIAVLTDKEGRIIVGYKKDGSVYYGAGCPPQIIEYFDKYPNIVTFIGTLLNGEEDLLTKLNQKVDVVSGKVLISENVESVMSIIDNPEYISAEVDSLFRLIKSIHKDGTYHIFKDLKVDGHIINEDINRTIDSKVFDRNVYHYTCLTNACRMNKDTNTSKDIQVLIIADNHASNLPVENAISLANNFDTIDCIVHTGDISGSTYDPEYAEEFFNIMKGSNKPYFATVGNHDVGNTMLVYYGATHEDIYNSYVKPLIEAGILKNGEYSVNKPYYYHDFNDRNIRLISIYEYDCPLDSADCIRTEKVNPDDPNEPDWSEYWEPVTYDSSYPKIHTNETYVYDENNPTFKNCANFTGCSFKLKKTVTIRGGQYSDVIPSDNRNNTIPTYKCGRSERVIMQEQAEWLVNTLKNTPDGYGIIISTHNPAMQNSTNQADKKFAIESPMTAWQAGGQYCMSTDILSEIVNAFINKQDVSLKVVMSDGIRWHGGGASYLNTVHDDGTYCYKIDVEFSNRVNNDAYFGCYIGGHVHKDMVFKHNSYNNQFSINPICANNAAAMVANADVARPYSTDGLSYDALTTVSVSGNLTGDSTPRTANIRIALARLGNDRTIQGTTRDYEVINVNYEIN